MAVGQTRQRSAADIDDNARHVCFLVLNMQVPPPAEEAPEDTAAEDGESAEQPQSVPQPRQEQHPLVQDADEASFVCPPPMLADCTHCTGSSKLCPQLHPQPGCLHLMAY